MILNWFLVSRAQIRELLMMCWLGIETKGMVWNAVVFHEVCVSLHTMLLTVMATKCTKIRHR